MPATVYRITVQGHLDPIWSQWLHDLVISHRSDGTTQLSGELPDQSALLGCLMKLRNIGALLIRIDSCPTEQDASDND